MVVRRRGAVVCSLPAGTPTECVTVNNDDPIVANDDRSDTWIQLIQPVRGWTLRHSLQVCVERVFVNHDAACTAAVFSAMQAARDDGVGRGESRGQCIRTSRRLRDLFDQQATLRAALRALGLWPVELRHTGFCSPPDPDFARWHAHAFLQLADGSIADCTADQFGDMPLLAWPAERRRYDTFGVRPNAARAQRRTDLHVGCAARLDGPLGWGDACDTH